MYLVFILFAFIYAPTNSLDSLLYSTRSLKRSTNLLTPETKVLRDSIQSDTGFINQYKTLYYSVVSINDTVDYLINKLDTFQSILLESKKKGEGEYPANFRSASMANKTFIYTHAAEDLRKSIETLKSDLDKAGFTDFKVSLDSLLPTNPIIKNSKGSDRQWTTFFFAKTPKAVLLLTTEKIKNDLLNLNKDLWSHLVAMRERERAPKAPTMAPDNALFAVKLMNGDVIPLHFDWSEISDTAVRERFYAELAAKNKLTAVLNRDGADISTAVFNQKPQKPVPPVVLNNDQMYAFVGGGGYNELYLGIDNPVDIVYSAPAGYTKQVVVSEGELINKSGKSYLRFQKEGFTKVSVYAVRGAEKKLLQERDFKVILIPNPDVYLSGYKGGLISKDIVRVARTIEVKNEDNNINEELYTCESFDVTLVPFDNPIGEIRVRGNSGCIFSAESKEILKNVKRGDVIVLDNFKIRTPEGMVRRIPTVVYRVI